MEGQSFTDNSNFITQSILPTLVYGGQLSFGVTKLERK